MPIVLPSVWSIQIPIFFHQKKLFVSIGCSRVWLAGRSSNALFYASAGTEASNSRCKSANSSPLRGTSSSGVTAFTTPRYPSVLSNSIPFPPLEFFAFFFPSRVGEEALHEKLSPLCLLLMDRRKSPRVGRACRPIRRVVHFGPDVSTGRYPSHLAGLLKGITPKA
ncbi:hypothetical protein AVEN_220682-1 [Araneus ventricosus]|uniref:Uncharacterized protein n=1 Tax=Araneus ventricosus TaxID=182803 RepID=A0A4Y2NZR8_ARAVE|nr:hypothetical protein AVEN_220682-1 [Araneus ventricosus]